MKITKYVFLLFIFLNNHSFGQKSKDTYSLQELQMKFKHKNYTEKVLLDFQKTIAKLRNKPQLHEDIPGEIISWYTLNGLYSLHKTYRIQKARLNEISTVPNEDSFLNKLNSYVPEKSKFTYSSDLWSFAFVTNKLNDKFYLIKATVKSFNSYPEIPNEDILIYELEYKSKDFKKFYLIRLKEMQHKDWIEVEQK